MLGLPSPNPIPFLLYTSISVSGVFVWIVAVGRGSHTFQISYLQRNPKMDVGRGSDTFLEKDMPGPSVLVFSRGMPVGFQKQPCLLADTHPLKSRGYFYDKPCNPLSCFINFQMYWTVGEGQINHAEPEYNRNWTTPCYRTFDNCLQNSFC